MESISAYGILRGRKLVSVRALGAWSANRHALSPSGALLFEFAGLSLLCCSPLRFRASQEGSHVGLASGATATFGFRVYLGPRDAAALLAAGLHESNDGSVSSRWTNLTLPSVGNHLDDIDAIQARDGTWEMEFAFERGITLRLRYRLDLDGSLEFAPASYRYEIDAIKVTGPDGPLGWLHPAAPNPFVLDQRRWKSASFRDWPFTLQKAMRTSAEPERRRHDVLLAAMAARFEQRPRLRRRVAQLRYPVVCADCPADIYDTLRDRSSDASRLRK